MVKKIHFCPKCGSGMEKVTGTRGTYYCQRCGYTGNPNKSTTLGDLL